ncbi:MAG: c-type cytochrome [Alphaproteobacteria bacterium]|nr:c-type cytochrome [Alphaproteobacteria bacterium]
MRTAVFLAAAMALAMPAMAQEAPPEGKSLFLTKTCVACHGKDGSKAILGYPNLAGLDKTYLLTQMKDIASGARMSGKDERGYPRTQGMKDIMHLVTEAEMTTIADWLSKLPAAPLKPGTDDAARLEAGAKLYEKTNCKICHGPQGTKPLPTYSLIAGQKKAYLVQQMVEIRDGVRGNGRVKTMVPSVKKLSDDDIGLLADFLSSVQVKK